MDALHVMLSCHHFSKVMVNFCSVANCLNSSRNRPDLPFLLTLPNKILEGFGRSFVDEVIPNSENKKPFGFVASSINKLRPRFFSWKKRLHDRKKRTSHKQCPKPKKSRVTKEGKDTVQRRK